MDKFNQNLTEGSVGKQLLKFSLPFLISMIIQALYNIVDTLVVGWFVGPTGISGVSIGGQVSFLFTNFIVGFTTGGTIMVAQYFGAGRKNDIQKTIGTLFSVLIISAVIMTVFMLFFSGHILRLIDTPEEAFGEAKSYLDICMLGTVFIFGYNAISSILRGLGDSKRPLYFVIIACVTNILLDLLLVGVFKTGAAGAAVATIISQALSVLLSAFYLHKNNFIFDFKPKSFKIYKDKLFMLFKIGFPSSVQNVVVGLSFIFITSMVNGFGVDASAAVGIVGKFNSIAILPTVAISMSISSMAGQNIGAGYFDRAMNTMWSGIKIIVLFGTFVFLCVQMFPGVVLSIFTDQQNVIDYGTTYIRSFSFDYLILTIVFSINGLINGSGHTTFGLMNSMLSSVLIRVPVAYIFGIVLDLGLFGIGLGAPVAAFISLIAGFLYIKSGRWKRPKLDKVINNE